MRDLPVDDAGHPPPLKQEIARPHVTVDERDTIENGRFVALQPVESERKEGVCSVTEGLYGAGERAEQPVHTGLGTGGKHQMIDFQVLRIEEVQRTRQLHQVPSRRLPLRLVVDGREIRPSRQMLEQDRAECCVVTKELRDRDRRIRQGPQDGGVSPAAPRVALVAEKKELSR